jgi:hypothetical protein
MLKKLLTTFNKVIDALEVKEDHTKPYDRYRRHMYQ